MILEETLPTSMQVAENDPQSLATAHQFCGFGKEYDVQSKKCVFLSGRMGSFSQIFIISIVKSSKIIFLHFDRT